MKIVVLILVFSAVNALGSPSGSPGGSPSGSPGGSPSGSPGGGHGSSHGESHDIDSVEMKYVSFNLNQVKELLENEDYSAATNLLEEIFKFAVNNDLYPTTISLFFKLEAMKEIKNQFIKLDQLRIEHSGQVDLQQPLFLLASLKLIAEQKGFSEALPFLELKLQNAIQDKFMQIDLLIEYGPQTDSLFLISDLYYLAKYNNLTEVVNMLIKRVKILSREVLKDMFSAKFLDETIKAFLAKFADELLPNWTDNISPRTEFETREDIDVFFGSQIRHMLFYPVPNSDPGHLIEAFVNGNGFCSLFRHSGTQEKDLSMSNDIKVRFAKVAYLLTSLVQNNEFDASEFDRDQIALIKMAQVCNDFRNNPLDKKERKLFISQLINEKDFHYLKIDWQAQYSPDGWFGVCALLIQRFQRDEIFGDRDLLDDNNLISLETKGYFFDECIDDFDFIWLQNILDDNAIGYVEFNLIDNWLTGLNQFVEGQSVQFQDFLALYDSLILDSIEISHSALSDLLDPDLNHHFDVFLNTSIEQQMQANSNSPHELDYVFEFGKNICTIFDQDSEIISPGQVMSVLLSYWYKGYRMSGRLFNNNLNPLRFSYLESACVSIELKYLQNQLDYLMLKFKELIQEERQEEAIILYARLQNLAVAEEMFQDILSSLRSLFQSINWKLSVSFLEKLFESKLIENILQSLNVQWASEITSHLHELAQQQNSGSDNEEVKRILETKLQSTSLTIELYHSIFDQFNQMQGMGPDETLLKLSDLYYYVIIQQGADHFLKLFTEHFQEIYTDPNIYTSKLFSIKLLNFDKQFIFDHISEDIGLEGRSDSTDKFFRSLIRQLPTATGRDSGALIKAFLNGSGFCSIFKHPNDPTFDIDKNNENEVKFAKVAFLFSQLQEKANYDIPTPNNETRALRQMIFICRSFQKYPLDPTKRKIFLTLLLDQRSIEESPFMSSSNHYYSDLNNESVCAKLSSIVLEDNTFEANFPSAETRGYFLDECADDLDAFWEDSLNSNTHWLTYKLSLINRWILRIKSFLEREMPRIVFEDNLALIDSQILPRAPSVLNDLLNPSQNEKFDRYLRIVMNEVSDIEAVSAYHQGRGICELFELNLFKMNKIFNVLRHFWSQGHRMHGYLFDAKLSQMRFVFLKAVCSHLKTKADSDTQLPLKKKLKRV